MAARKTPSEGRKSDKFMRNAIMVALHRACDKGDRKKLNVIAEKLVELACEGDLGAIREVIDRVDGRAIQEATLTIDDKRDAADWTTAELLAVLDESEDRGDGSSEAPSGPEQSDIIH